MSDPEKDPESKEAHERSAPTVKFVYKAILEEARTSSPS